MCQSPSIRPVSLQLHLITNAGMTVTDLMSVAIIYKPQTVSHITNHSSKNL